MPYVLEGTTDPRYTGPTPVSASMRQGLMHTLVHAFFRSVTQLCAHPELCSEHPEVSLAQSLLEVFSLVLVEPQLRVRPLPCS